MLLLPLLRVLLHAADAMMPRDTLPRLLRTCCHVAAAMLLLAAATYAALLRHDVATMPAATCVIAIRRCCLRR